MRLWAPVVLLIMAAVPADAQEKHVTWAERLGYPAGKKVIVLHADDIGMCHEANASAERYLQAGEIQSASAMVPCPWFDQFADWAKQNPKHDVGLHLTLTSEWKHYRWGPITPRAKVPGLIDPQGYLWKTIEEVAEHATPAEVETEIRAQIERAKTRGLEPSHLDTHMGTLYATPEFAKVFLRVAHEYGIPPLTIEMTPPVVKFFRAEGYPITDDLLAFLKDYPMPKLDAFFPVPKAKDYDDLVGKITALVQGLPPGITEIIFHPSDETKGLAAITDSWKQRSWEARLFADPKVKAMFEAEGCVFTNWKEMMERYRAKVQPAGSK